MLQSVSIAKKIVKDLGKNWIEELNDINIYSIFKPIYHQTDSIETLNAIVAFIILAYDNDSSWLNLHQDRLDNKKRIFFSLDVELSDYFNEIIYNENEKINDVIGEYLINATTWKWKTAMSLLDYHANMIRFATNKTDTEQITETLDKNGQKVTLREQFDIDTIAKVNKQKGELLKEAISAREKADSLLADIRKDYVQLDSAVQADFGFSITDEKKLDTTLWRNFIKERNKKKLHFGS